jgi:hypothetical protein
MNDTIRSFDKLKANIFSLSIVSVLFIGSIYILYGEELKGIFTHYPDLRLYQLYSQYVFFKNETISTVRIGLPATTAFVGYYSIISVYILFYAFLILAGISTYLKLLNGTMAKAVLMIEWIILLTLFVVFFNPGLGLFLSVLGYLLILGAFFLLLLYRIHEIKSLNEKK